MSEPRGVPSAHAQFSRLFSPLAIGPVTLRNRLVLLPMGSRFARDGSPTDGDIAFYRARARGGIALVITGGSPVHPTGTDNSHSLYEPFSERAQPYLGKLADAVHAEGAKIFGQIFHRGVIAAGPSDWPTWAPSAIASHVLSDPQIAHEMTLTEIEEIIAAFAKSAANLRARGFDGIEIHGAHGYLVGQFLAERTNLRQDRYGGSPEKRMRFLLDLVDAIRAEIGPELALGVRMSADEGEEVVDGIRLPYSEQVARALAATGKVDYISVAMGIRGTYVKDMSVSTGPALPLAAAIRKASGLPVIASQRLNHPAIAENALAGGQADLIGMARALICDWELPAKARDGRVAEIRPCIACIQVCRSGVMGCIHSPTAGRERVWGPGTLQKAAAPRKIVVVGGGPAGLEAAMIAAERGHKVVLFEAARRLGGQARIAALAPNRIDVDGVVSYRELELARLGVDVRLAVKADAAMVMAEKPDAVVVATGSVPLPLEVEGGDLPHVIDVVRVQDPDEATRRLLDCARSAVVIDDGSGFWETCSAAEALGKRGIQVAFVTPGRIIGGNLPFEAIGPLTRRLRWLNAELLPMHRVSAIAPGTASVYDTVRLSATRTLEERELPADIVVGFAGKRVVAELASELSGKVELHLAGDCVSPRRINNATFDGHRIARAL